MNGFKTVYSKARIAKRVGKLGQQISRDYAGQTVDVIILLENAFMFGADLVRGLKVKTVCHFVRTEVREVRLDGQDRREVYFGDQPGLSGRHVLLVTAVLHTGITQDFLIKRLQEHRPRSLRLVALVDKPKERRVDLSPDYIGFAAASNYLVGYGLPGPRGLYRNLPLLGEFRRTPGRLRRRRRSRHAAKGKK